MALFNPNFDIDLKYGKVGEESLAALLGNRKIEVKRDRLAHLTGNLLVEFESWGKPSGIQTTKAAWWAFIIAGADDKLIFLVETEMLKELFLFWYKKRGWIRTGDKQASKSVQIPFAAVISRG